MNVNFEDLKVIFLTETKSNPFHISRIQLQKKKRRMRKWMEIMSIKGEGGGGPTLNGKFHFKFPFCFSDYLP